jgi:hypothetical protein
VLLIHYLLLLLLLLLHLVQQSHTLAWLSVAAAA